MTDTKGDRAIAKWKWLLEQAMEHGFTPAEGATLAYLLALEEDGRATATKAQLGALVGVGERQITNILGKLETVLTLIAKRRDGGVGKGRQANTYTLRADATGNPLPVADSNRKSSAGNPLPVTTSNQQSSSGNPFPVASNRKSISGSQPGNPLPVACEQLPAPYKNASARAETLTLNITTSEIYPERTELAAAADARPLKILNGRAVSTPSPELARVLFEQVDSRWLDPSKSPDLNTSHARIRAWMAAGADFDTVIVPTIRDICARPRSEPIGSLIYFDRPIATAIAKLQRAEAPLLIEENHVNASSASVADVRVRREPVSPTTAARMRRQQRREAERGVLDYGRVDSERLG